MIFGFGGKKQQEEDHDEEIELVQFQGAFSGVDVDLSEHTRVVAVGMPRAKELISEALNRSAELLRLEPKGDRVIAQMMIDGMGHAGARLSSKEGLAVVQSLKLVSGMDVRERKKPQQGGIKAEFNDRKYYLMTDTKPLEGGVERFNIQLVDVKDAKYSPQELGFGDELVNKIRELASGKKGILLAAGPPGSGTTTLSYAILRGIDAYLYSIFTVINPWHRELKNITTFERREGEALEDVLQRINRIEGDVVYIEPISSPQVAKAALQRQEELVLVSEMVTRDAASAIETFSKLSGDPSATANAIRGVFSQKLIRRLCERCKQPYRPNPKFLQKVGLPDTVQTLYRPYKPEEGEQPRYCKRCKGAGYLGRVAMIELIEMTDDMKKLVAAGRPAADLKTQARKEKMPNIKDSGLQLVADGVTSLEELQRIFKA